MLNPSEILTLAAQNNASKIAELCKTEIFDNTKIAEAKWTRCSDRLPPKHEDVLITVRFSDDTVSHVTFGNRCTNCWSVFDSNDVLYVYDNDDDRDTEIIAWSKLPKPCEDVK